MKNGSILLSFFLLFSSINGDELQDPLEELNIKELQNDAVFVSLGSFCGPAGFTRSAGFRTAAFPFDWLVFPSEEKLIQLLNEDFLYFLDKNYLIPDHYLIPFYTGATLVNTYYHFQFCHDGTFHEGPEHNQNSNINMEKLIDKYTRRIQRFRELNNLQGRVFFIRSSYGDALVNPNYAYKYESNLDISKDHALQIFDALKNRFPNPDIYLIIMNNKYLPDRENNEWITERILITQVPPTSGDEALTKWYKELFINLLSTTTEAIASLVLIDYK